MSTRITALFLEPGESTARIQDEITERAESIAIEMESDVEELLLRGGDGAELRSRQLRAFIRIVAQRFAELEDQSAQLAKRLKDRESI